VSLFFGQQLGELDSAVTSRLVNLAWGIVALGWRCEGGGCSYYFRTNPWGTSNAENVVSYVDFVSGILAAEVLLDALAINLHHIEAQPSGGVAVAPTNAKWHLADITQTLFLSPLVACI
jgi:hypothetical protein